MPRILYLHRLFVKYTYPSTVVLIRGRKGLRAGAAVEARFDTWYDLNLYDRCITREMPGATLPGFYNHNYQTLQTPDYVVIRVEMIHDARIIPLDGRGHLASQIGQWLGDFARPLGGRHAVA